jgi:hypothetical protein
MTEGLLLEEFGGEVQAAEVSALEGIGIDDLLDKVAIQVSLTTISSFNQYLLHVILTLCHLSYLRRM